MAEWTKFNDRNKLSRPDERTNKDDIIIKQSYTEVNNDAIINEDSDATNDRNDCDNEREKTIADSSFTRELEYVNGFRNNSELLEGPLNQEEEERFVEDNHRERIGESGSKIRREARQELKEILQNSQNSPKRPNSLYKEDVPSSQKLKSVYNERNTIFGSPTRILSSKGRLSTENSTEKLANGKFPKEDKQQHHVQFNKDSKKQQLRHTSEERPQPSPSISTSTTSSFEDNSSLAQFCEARPPDGGWGWVVVAASFMVNLIADGITFSFGVIYVEFLNYFGGGKSKTAWIGSLFMAMPLLSGPVASFLTDRYGCRRVTVAGSILATAGFVISSYANSMEILILTFGILAGFGLSLCFVAAVVIVAYYFDKKRSFATGLSVCGSGIGTFIFAPVTQYLLAEYGWRGTTLILAGLFSNLAVCGCLMRDLEWTTTRAKAKTQERRKNREKKRSKMQSSNADSFSATSSANTTTQTPHGDSKRGFASANAMIIENLRLQDGDEESEKLFSSLVSLPTFVKNREKVPVEVLELLSTNKAVYNVLLQNYPSLLISSKSFSDSGALHDQLSTPSARFIPTPSPLAELKIENGKDRDIGGREDNDEQTLRGEQHHGGQSVEPAYLWWLKKIDSDTPLRRCSSTQEQPKRLPTAYLNDIRMHRHSLTYRGAMLNINRYRLRASSCPDIYRNSMTTIAKTKLVWYAGLWEFWDLIVDMLDFSYFADPRFLLFAVSNFLLHTWYDVPYVYLTDNAIEVGFSETDASILISVIGIANMGGEIFLGWAGDRAWVNASIVYAVCMALCGAVTALIPIVVNDYYTLCAISGAFGLFIAANYSLTSIILVELITLERFTNAYGLLLLVQGVANLMGPPLAGWLYDITGTYDLSFYLAGLFIALSGALLLVMPLISLYRKYRGNESEEGTVDKDFNEIDNV
ncbi:monocarboxylate transporter 9 [Anoplolepis gracilipes]|uniref:monocarboxylate transporter 9 n=1 Tax=Anoplolepis gracilipes TaxID=354296 RepID=UPI003BA1DEC4